MVIVTGRKYVQKHSIHLKKLCNVIYVSLTYNKVFSLTYLQFVYSMKLFEPDSFDRKEKQTKKEKKLKKKENCYPCKRSESYLLI